MNIEKIVLELMSRIQNLEEQVKELSEDINEKKEIKIGTAEIKEYILQLKKNATREYNKELVLKANDIHNKLNLKSRMPAVCSAMRQCMDEGDIVVHETPSGYSSTLEIKYIIKKRDMKLFWESLKNFQNKEFYTITNSPFRFEFNDECNEITITTNKTNMSKIYFEDFEKANEIMPVSGPGELQKAYPDMQVTSYVYALLKDERL